MYLSGSAKQDWLSSMGNSWQAFTGGEGMVKELSDTEIAANDSPTFSESCNHGHDLSMVVYLLRKK